MNHDNNNPPAASQTSIYKAEVPYNSSITFIAVVTFLSPLATLLWSLHHANNPIDDHDYYQHDADTYHHRHLTDPSCNVTDSTITAVEESSTWDAIRYTTIISASVAFLCLLGYELFRRDPIVGKYVYDRKRLTQPGRTPPPLMLSRSLWRGYNDDKEEEDNNDNATNNKHPHRTMCCKVRPAILELIFLNLDKNYIRYSQRADEARREREKRGYYTTCRTGRYHNNCCNTHGRRFIKSYSDDDGGEEDFFVDEDGYTFFPGYWNGYSHEYQDNENATPPDLLVPEIMGRSGPGSQLASNNQPQVQSPRTRKSVCDLFPEDDPRNFFAASRPEASRRTLFVDDQSSGGTIVCSPKSNETGERLNVLNTAEIGIESPERSVKSPSGRYQRGMSIELTVPSSYRDACTTSGEDERSKINGPSSRTIPFFRSAESNETEEGFIGTIEEGGNDNAESPEPDACITSGEDESGKIDANEPTQSVELGAQDDIPLVTESNANSDNNTIGTMEEGGNDNEEPPKLDACARSGDEEPSKRDGNEPTQSVELGAQDDIHVKVDTNIPLLTGINANSDTDTLVTTEEKNEPSKRDVNEPTQSVELGAQDGIHVKVDSNIPLLSERDIETLVATEEETNHNEENAARDSDSSKPLKYPYRLKYIFMPPGFHTWTNVLNFLGYFFFLPALFRWYGKIPTPSLPLPSRGSGGDDNNNRRRSSVPIMNPGKDLTEGEEEFLRCAGLDTYLLVRLARFGFDVTFYPFLLACGTVLPIYQSCKNQDEAVQGGYLSLTINVVPDGDKRMVWILVFTILLYLYIMRRLWFEWEVFIKLRHSFLANGDTSFHKSPTYLRTYRNTVMVERVPLTHRSDRNLKDVFESLFPGQIDHAEMLIDTSTLVDLVTKRQKLIGKYDTLSARYRYEEWRYQTWDQKGKLVGPCSNSVSKPVEPKVWSGGLCSDSRKQEDAFAYYNKKIIEMDKLADEEYDSIVEKRMKCHDASLLQLLEDVEEEVDHPAQFAAQNLYNLFVPSKIRQLVFGEESPFFYGTGIVEFKSIAAKQSAVQCNLSGQPYWMITNDAPDPRDLFWSNIGVDRNTVENRKIIVQCVLLLGILGWGAIVSYIQKTVKEVKFDGIASGGLIENYLPALVVSLVLLWIPALIFLLARHVIRFKSHTQCDEFVLVWNTGYRLANVFFTLFSISLIDALKCLREDPEQYVLTLADGVIRQSTFLMNLMILAAGQETMLQLLQWRSLLKQAVFRPLINTNTRSRRYLDRLNEAPEREQSFIFGFFAPVLSYGLMIAMIFAFMAPIMLGVCAIFFWIATKVHTNNALFVYCQRSEGGGKIFYYWNRIVFITLYSSIIFFSAILLLKQYASIGLPFLIIMTLITYCVDKSVKNTFVVNSLHLPISIARIHDEEEVALIADSNIKPDGGENFMYRHPILIQENWNSKPTWK